MKIGSLQLSSNLIQAPLAGYSCAPFRKLAWRYGQPGFCCTEMLSAMHIHNGSPQKRRFTYKDKDEGLLAFQLAGYKAEALITAAKQALHWGADLIDLNCGCPQPKIRKKNLGSKLLAHSKLLYQLIKALKENTHLPVTAKIRVDGLSGDRYNAEVADAIEQAGADALSVHGRHWTDDYDVPCHYQDIANIKQRVSIPVIANGDITDVTSAKHMLDTTGCDGIMIARASVGQPWLFAQIRAELNDETFKKPTLMQTGEIFSTHVRELIALEGEYLAILESRKLGKYYSRGQVDRSFLEKLYQIDRFAQFEELIARYFYDDLSSPT